MSQMIIDRKNECAIPPRFRLRAVTHSDQLLTSSGLVRCEDPRWRDALAPPDRYKDEVFALVARRSYRPFAAGFCALLAVAGAGAYLTSGREIAEGAVAPSEIQAALDMRDARGADVYVPISSLLFELAPTWSAVPVQQEPARPEPPRPQAAVAPEASQGAAPLELHPRLAPLPPRRPASLDAAASPSSPLRAPPRSMDLASAAR